MTTITSGQRDVFRQHVNREYRRAGAVTPAERIAVLERLQHRLHEQGTLPTEQAEVVVLKIWEEMTFAEIGKILEVSTFTAASRYRYAMHKLTERLDSVHAEVSP